MTLDELTRTTGEWLTQRHMSDVVLSSRIRLARNLADYPFLATANATERTEIYRCLADGIASSSDGEDMLLVDLEETDPIDREILAERHLISRQHVNGEGARGVTYHPPKDGR